MNIETIAWVKPHPAVTAEYRAAIDAKLATENALGLARWEREMAALPDEDVEVVYE